MAKKKSPVDSIIIDKILEHFNIQSTMGRQQVLSGRDFDRLVIIRVLFMRPKSV